MLIIWYDKTSETFENVNGDYFQSQDFVSQESPINWVFTNPALKSGANQKKTC